MVSRGQFTKVCSFCGKSDHSVDSCYKKHGYPPHWKHNSSAVNNVQADDDLDEISSIASSRKEAYAGPESLFTP